MTVQLLIEQACRILEDGDIPEPRKEAFIFFQEVFSKGIAHIYAHSEEMVSPEKESLFLSYIRLRAKHIPAAYILRKACFLSLEFHVFPGILIPRPETEILCEKVLEEVSGSESPSFRVLDLCTGSGCIGIALSRSNPRICCVLSDISVDCGKAALENIRLHGLENRVSFLQSDLFHGVTGRFDLIVSNPPYVRSPDLEFLMEDVRDHEPLLALDGGSDGLYFFRRIIREAGNYLVSGGRLYLECGAGQAGEIFEMLWEAGYTGIEIFRDYAGIQRVLKAALISL